MSETPSGTGHTEEAMRRVHAETQVDEAAAAEAAQADAAAREAAAEQTDQGATTEAQQADTATPGEGEGQAAAETQLADQVAAVTAAVGVLATKMDAMLDPRARGRGRPGDRDPRSRNGNNGNGQQNGRARRVSEKLTDGQDYLLRIPKEARRLMDFKLTPGSLRALEGWNGEDRGYNEMLKRLKKEGKEGKLAAQQLEARRPDIMRLHQKDRAINSIPGSARAALRVHAESAMGAEADKLLAPEGRGKRTRFNDTALDQLTRWDGSDENLDETIRLLAVGNAEQRAAAVQLRNNRKLLGGLGDSREFGGMMAEQAERAVRNEQAKIPGKTGQQILETIDLELANMPSYPAYLAHVARAERIRGLSGAERVQAGAERAAMRRAILAGMVRDLETDIQARREALSRIYEEDLVGVESGTQKDIDLLKRNNIEITDADARDELNRLEDEITQMENTRLMWLNKELPEPEPVTGIRMEEVRIEEEARTTPPEDVREETETEEPSSDEAPDPVDTSDHAANEERLQKRYAELLKPESVKNFRTRLNAVVAERLEAARQQALQERRGFDKFVTQSALNAAVFEELVLRYTGADSISEVDQTFRDQLSDALEALDEEEAAKVEQKTSKRPGQVGAVNLEPSLDDEDIADPNVPRPEPLVNGSPDDELVDAEVVDDTSRAKRMTPAGAEESDDKWGYYRSREEKAADIVDAEIVEEDETPATGVQPGMELELHPSPDSDPNAPRLAKIEADLAAKRQELSQTTVDDEDQASMNQFVRLEDDINRLVAEQDEVRARQAEPQQEQ